MTPPNAHALAAPQAGDVHLHIHSLGRHLQQCRRAHGHAQGLGRLADRVHGWVAPRFVTTLTLAALLIALACL